MRISLPFGWMQPIGDNEVEIVSTMPDPPKLRLAIERQHVESNLGAVSFNLRRPDGTHDEYALVMGRLSPDRQGGALYLAVRPPGQEEVREVAYFDHAHVIFRAKVEAPNIHRSGSWMFSGNQRFLLNVQDDGNLVLYDNKDGQAVPIWASGTGGR